MSKKKFLAGWLSVTALLLVGALLAPSPGGKEDIRTAMRDAVLHGENHISLFGVKEVNPAFISAMVVAGVLLLAAVLVLAVVPFFLAPGAEFGGSDDAGSRMVEEIQGEAYEPWFTPVLETLLGGELPGEIESLLFCIQTGVGVGVLAYGFGYFVARKKYSAQSVE